MGERIRRSLITIEETANMLGQSIADLRAINHGDGTNALFADHGTHIIAPRHTPIHDVYTPQPILMGEEVEDCRFVFGIGKSVKEERSSGLYFGIDRLTGKTCVAKVSRVGTLDETQARRSVQREGELMGLLSTDRIVANSIVHVHDIQVSSTNEFGEEALTVVNIQEYLSPEDGWFPVSMVDKDVFDMLTADELVTVFGHITRVVGYMADVYGIFHNDLHNIFINRKTLAVKLHDFSNATGVYDDDIVLGTREFSSPEWFHFMVGDTKTEPGMPSEIYSLTVLLYYLMTKGHVPFILTDFEYRTFHEDLTRGGYRTYCLPDALDDLYESPFLSDDGQSEAIYRVVQQGIAYYPEDRYTTAQELCRAFAEAVKQE